jgi:hypothetical protein
MFIRFIEAGAIILTLDLIGFNTSDREYFKRRMGEAIGFSK